MRILLVTTDIDHIEPLQFIGAQDKGATVEVICSPRCINLELFEQAAIPVHKMHIHGWRNRAVVGQLKQHIERFQPDIVHVLRKPALLHIIPALRGSKAKLIAYRGIVGNLSFLDPKSLLSFLHPRVDCIVCVADAIRQHFLRMGFGPLRLDPSKLVTIYKGHSLARYQEVARIDVSQFGVPIGPAIIGFCGAMRPRKGVDILVEAFGLMQNRSSVLLLVGDITAPRITKAIRNSPRQDAIFCAGRVSQADALALNGRFDVTTMPSLKREGLPRALIEAMAQGTPAVVSNVGGSPELVEHGVSGLVVPPGDAPALAQALDRILEKHTLQTMGEAARQRIASQFNVRTTVEQNWALYQRLLSHS